MLRAVGLPDARAGALLKSSEYRYPRPSALQDVLFYSHPSVEQRISAAMVWKAECSDKQSHVKKQDMSNGAPN